MRLSTITNWAYGATVALTLVSGTTMLLASNTQQRERDAVAQRYRLDQATADLEHEIFALTDHARQYLNTGDDSYAVLYRSDVAGLASIEERLRHVRDAGASASELDLLAQAMRWADTLHDEQKAALATHDRGDEAGADPWDAWTLEWSTPSPPPAYNFATDPEVASRRPLWDLKHPEDPDSAFE
jgi:hypothetical protein